MSGTVNSVNTNVGAMIALDALNSTNSALNGVQKQISTGFRVSDATDDGAAYAVAQSVRSSVGALATANQQLGSTQGLLSTTSAALNDTSNLMASMRDVLVALSNGAREMPSGSACGQSDCSQAWKAASSARAALPQTAIARKPTSSAARNLIVPPQ